ncbi:MAG: NERD domain-containing protein [Actinobacteria bacterium]|nr:NERD domain-containing protein [Actinomycetota bacterium]
MIEGGNAGGSALAQASQRRATADRLITEATWLERVASDERAMAAELAKLPETYTILHDLQVPGSKGNIDHVVIGPGGAFMIITRRHDEGVAFRDGQLFVGDTPMRPDLEAARQDATLLAQSLGVQIAPVLGLCGAPVPASVPPVVDGVLVTAAEQIERTIVQHAHTMMPTPKIAEAAERALPLLHSPGTTPRVLVAAAARQAAAPAVPAMALAAPAVATAESTKATSAAATRSAAQQEKRRDGASTNPIAKLFAGRTGGKKSAAFVVASIGSLCLVAFAAGSLVRVLWPSSDESNAAVTTVVPSSVDASTTTTVFIDTASTVLPTTLPPTTLPPVAAVPAPAVNFTPACSAPGAGWTLVPNWPGDLPGMFAYVIQIMAPDGTWTPHFSFATPAEAPAAAIAGQGPSVTVTVQILAVMADGSVSPGAPTALITPATAC